MHLEEIHLSGFRSFSKPQMLDLRDLKPGLYLVTGENKEHPKLEANGVGKSTLFDAVMWALRGETSRGLRASNIKSWKGKNPTTVALKIDGVRVERSWRPNHIKVDGEELTQDQLDEAMRLTSDVLQNTFYFSQFGQFFLDLKPSQRLPIYASVLQLELWERKSDTAKRLAREAMDEVVDAEKASERAEADYDNLRDQCITYKEKHEAWVEGQAERIQECREELEAAQRKAAAAVKKQKASTKALKAAQAQLTAAEGKLEDAAEHTAKTREAWNAARTEAATARGELRAAREAEDMAVVDGTSCPACGQPLDKHNRKTHKAKLRAARSAAEKKEKELMAGVMELAEAVEQAERAEEPLRRAVRAAEKNLRAEESNQIRAEARPEDADVRRLQRELTTLENEDSPYLALYTSAKAKLKAAKVSMKKAHKAAEEAREAQALFEFWVKGFKDIRFQVMQESLVQLNAEVNECLHDLGLEGWKLDFQVERETKSGTLARGFQCLVSSPKSPEAVPWEAWSGGETQRLRIVAQMGVSNMISSRLGISLDVEMWDEPSNWLNAGGIKSALELLRERATRYERRIFVADHRSLDFDFDGVLRIIKSSTQGSLLLPSWVS